MVSLNRSSLLSPLVTQASAPLPEPSSARARCDGDMNQGAGHLFPGARGMGPRAAHAGGAINDHRHVDSPANASSTSGHGAKHQGGKRQHGRAPEAARQGEMVARGRRRPRAVMDWGRGWTVFQIPSTPGLQSPSICGSKSQRKILKILSRTEEEISKQPTKFQSHPRSEEGEIKSRKSGGGVDSISNTVHPRVLVFQLISSQTEI